ncbi:hypothetical protein Bca52824_032776 [Brassica carinata]|uniref:Uncharacterized protein n=1 Tax=Brassica carinata TaxID=52824 RepID=A0A8X7V5G3_BRACI|nr:hypothetical protein Bca52824_032776 [Brassica carinata]
MDPFNTRLRKRIPWILVTDFDHFMIQEGNKAEAQEDEIVVKEPELEKKQEPESEFEKQKEKTERNQKALKEKEMDNAAYKNF